MLKRLTALVMLLMLCAIFCSARAEGQDLAGLSNDALMRLYESVRQEMSIRGLLDDAGYTLPAGKYIVGQDIVPGRYLLKCTGTSGEELGSAYSSLGSAFGSLDSSGDSGYADLMGSLGGLMGNLVNARIQILGDYGTVLKSCELKKDQSVQITLEERTALEIQDGSCTLTRLN